ncbi:MAG: hypothetical protein QOG41_1932 [Thermoleophilaceae bacterium]|jgi:hypothetical protein|nr:hypothetical protein [Thermoleophilaceae bacterium]MEA2389159.1 hypothetical protein [Thermoleophilaceae bacterium]
MEHQDRADELEREADGAAEASERLEEDVEEARSDWEARKSDQSTPGAADPEATGPHHLEGDDPAAGESKRDERQAEVEDAAQADAERADDSETD